MARRGPGPLPIRERRLGAVGAYHGPAGSLAGAVARNEAPQRIRTFSQTKWDEIVAALQLLHGIRDAAVVVHGPAGCGAVKHYLDAYEGPGGPLLTTALSERDSIMGADEKLAEAVRIARARYGVRVVFVVTTPVTAINNDDVDAVALELSEELDIRVVPVHTDGFRSKIGSNGFDVVFHACVEHLLPEPGGGDGTLVNVLATVENGQDVRYLAAAVAALGRVPNVLPRASTVAALERSVRASASVAARTESRLLGELLQRERGVRFHLPLPPIGIAGSSRWLRELGAVLDLGPEAERLVQERERALAGGIERARGSLAGARVYVSGEGLMALSLAELVEEFGGEVAGLSLFDLDDRTADLVASGYHAHGWGFDLHVGEGQPFEQVNIVSRLRPDVYLGGLGQSLPVARHGIPAVCYGALPVFGHRAALDLVRRLSRAATRRDLVTRLAGVEAGYRGAWLAKRPDWYIKQEVR